MPTHRIKMIECKPYKAKFMTDSTCVAAQAQIIKFSGRKRKEGKQKLAGTAEILYSCPVSDYYKRRRCVGCETGQKLYAMAKAEGRV